MLAILAPRRRCRLVTVGLSHATAVTLWAIALGAQLPDSARARADSTRTPQRLNTVVVTPGTFGLLSPVRGTAQSLGREAILTRPQLGEDLFRSIQRLPGLASSDFGAAFHVRGAEVNQVHVSLDGMELFEPFHMKDFDNALSILDVQSVEGIDLVTSGFTTEYGGRLGSALSIRSREPRTDRLRTSLGVSVSNLRAQAEGGYGNGRGGWSVAARRGYLDLALRLAGRSDSISPVYNDLFATATWAASPQHRFAGHVLWADDRLNYKVKDGSINSSYASRYAWGTWDATYGERLSSHTVASAGHLAWARGGDAQIVSGGPRSTVDDDRRLDFGGVRQDWLWNASERALVKFGAEWRPEAARYSYAGVRIRRDVVADTIARTPTLVNAERHAGGSQLGVYVAPRWRPVRWLVAEVGARFDRTGWSHDATFSPRANVVLTVTPSTSLRVAMGRYAQPQQAYALQVQDGVTAFAREDVTQHRVIGLEQRFGLFAIGRAEVYERRATYESPRYINLRGDLRVFPELEADRALLTATSGRAQGVELSLRGLGQGGLDWALSWTHARVFDRVGSTNVARTWDQPNSVYADATWHPGERRWHMAVAVQAHTGWPESPVQFVLDTVKNSKGAKVPTVLTVYGPLTDLGTRRLPWYHRVDARVTREMTFGRRSLSMFVDVFNIFDAENVAAINYHPSASNNRITVGRTTETLLGWLPSAGITIEF